MVKVTAHAVIGSVVGDVLGKTLNQYAPMDRAYVVGPWIKQNLGEYPPNIKRPEETGMPSRNSEVLLLMLELLTDHVPVTAHKLKLFTEHYTELVEPFLIEREDHQFIVGSSLALGFFGGLASQRYDTDLEVLDDLLWAIYEPIAKLCRWDCFENISAIRTLVYVMRRTLVEGYFGVSIITRAIDLGLCTGNLAAVLDTFNKQQLTSHFLSAAQPNERWMEGLTYFERLLCIVFFYLYKVDSAAKGIKKPRFMIEDMVSMTEIGLQDLLMVFAAVCLCSEHNYLLFVTPLQETIPIRDELLSVVNQVLA